MNMCLPFFVTSDEEADRFISGLIPFEPLVPLTEQEMILSQMPYNIQSLSLNEEISNRVIYDLSDFSSKILTMGMLQYEEGKYHPINRLWQDEGTHAVVILNPIEFIERLSMYNEMLYPNFKSIEAAEIVYDDKMCEESEKDRVIHPYLRASSESWKNEIAIVSRCRRDVVLVPDAGLREYEVYNIGRMDEKDMAIAVKIPVSNLCDGKFPDEFYKDYVMDFIEKGSASLRKENFPIVTDVMKAFSCNIQDISPDKKYITLLQSVLDPTEWIPMTEMVNTATPNERTPVLVFQRVDGTAAIKFVVNTVECHFHGSAGSDDTIVRSLLELIESDFHTRFTHAAILRVFNMGPVEDDQNRWLMFDERRSHGGNGMIHFYRLSQEKMVSFNVFGFASAYDNFWKFEMQVIDEESVLWYDADNIVDFFSAAEKEMEDTVDNLTGGDIIERFHQI